MDRSSEIEAQLTKTSHRLHPEARGRLGGEPFERILRQPLSQAEEQIFEEEINEPIRALV